MAGTETYSIVGMNDFTCDLNCPLDEVGWCCKGCINNATPDDSNRHLWDEKKGFHSDAGCKLSREQRPDRCNKYNCKQYSFVVRRSWVETRWVEWPEKITWAGCKKGTEYNKNIVKSTYE